MRAIKSALIRVLLATSLAQSAAAEPDSQDGTTKLRVVAYNVACGQWATPEQIAGLLKPLNPDIVLLSEVPKPNRGKEVKDWSLRVAEELGLKHVHVGTSSSAGHKSPEWGDATGNKTLAVTTAIASHQFAIAIIAELAVSHHIAVSSWLLASSVQ